LGLAWFGNCVRGNGPSQSVSPLRSLWYHIIQQVEERIGFCFFASKSCSINRHHENLSNDHWAKVQRSGKCPVSSFAVPLAKQTWREQSFHRIPWGKGTVDSCRDALPSKSNRFFETWGFWEEANLEEERSGWVTSRARDSSRPCRRRKTMVFS